MRRSVSAFPRLPLAGSIDLTYRCHFNCRHCWLRIPPGAAERRQELSTDEIRGVVDQARALGCREWSISGGEPMLREDFPEVFDYVTRRSASYAINTNGSLITPAIARLMTRKGVKMVAIYGATAAVHDHVTRLPGSFEHTMRGFAYLREAGAAFIVQIIPLRDNYHQIDEMRRLARSLSPVWRIGAAWLYLTAEGDPERNAEIRRQRLDPAAVIDLDRPDMGSGNERHTGQGAGAPDDDRLFARCIAGRNEFHVDPYGGMSFCSFVKDPALRYDLRRGTFEEAWEQFIPSLPERVRGGQHFVDHCGSCGLRADCRWCPVYGYLEHRCFSAPVEYLCEVAQLARADKEGRRKNYRRYYQIAGMTVQVDSDARIENDTFAAKFEHFAAGGPSDDNLVIRHHFTLPRLEGKELGQQIYRYPPWEVYRKNGAWVYVGFRAASSAAAPPDMVMVFNGGHTHGDIYSNGDARYRAGDLSSLTMLPTDQIVLARVFAERHACILHSAGAVLDDAGFLFVGHSEAGKSTTLKLLMAAGAAKVLCDDRNVVRRWPDGWQVHGTWSHGEIPTVSGDSAPLRAVFFLEKSAQNRLLQLTDRRDVLRRLLGCVIRPVVTADWWDKTLSTLDHLTAEVPCYEMQFDTSGAIVEQLRGLTPVLRGPDAGG